MTLLCYFKSTKLAMTTPHGLLIRTCVSTLLHPDVTSRIASNHGKNTTYRTILAISCHPRSHCIPILYNIKPHLAIAFTIMSCHGDIEMVKSFILTSEYKIGRIVASTNVGLHLSKLDNAETWDILLTSFSMKSWREQNEYNNKLRLTE